MSDENVRKEEDQPPKGEEKKSRTLVGATHLLKAKALQQLELKDLGEEENTQTTADENSNDDTKEEPKPGTASSASDKVNTGKPDTSAEPSRRSEGADSKETGNSKSVGDTSNGLEENQSVINNLTTGLVDLGDDSVTAKPIGESKPSDNTGQNEAIVNSEKREIDAGDARFRQTEGEKSAVTEPNGELLLDEKLTVDERQTSEENGSSLDFEADKSPLGQNDKLPKENQVDEKISKENLVSKDSSLQGNKESKLEDQFEFVEQQKADSAEKPVTLLEKSADKDSKEAQQISSKGKDAPVSTKDPDSKASAAVLSEDNDTKGDISLPGSSGNKEEKSKIHENSRKQHIETNKPITEKEQKDKESDFKENMSDKSLNMENENNQQSFENDTEVRRESNENNKDSPREIQEGQVKSLEANDKNVNNIQANEGVERKSNTDDIEMNADVEADNIKKGEQYDNVGSSDDVKASDNSNQDLPKSGDELSNNDGENHDVDKPDDEKFKQTEVLKEDSENKSHVSGEVDESAPDHQNAAENENIVLLDRKEPVNDKSDTTDPGLEGENEKDKDGKAQVDTEGESKPEKGQDVESAKPKVPLTGEEPQQLDSTSSGNLHPRPISTANVDLSEEAIVKGTGIVLENSPAKETKEPAIQLEEGDVKKEEGNSVDALDGQEDLDETIVAETTEHTVPSDFYYDFDEIVSKPNTTEGIPEDMVNLYHSFGFECTKRSNMHMIDNDHIIFAAGNVLQILNIKTKQKRYIRSTKSGGIGAIAVHPSRKYFAVAEKGEKPDIIIYEYPSLKVYRILRDGTEKAYANLDFSPNGDKLASVGSAPDFMLTVWDWINENIVLRSKAFSQDVYKVAFSPEDEGHLCTSGTAHIRFWSMASTFTGLKLQGELGRFGTTELSDIAGFVELPDGKVLSGSEWGNMLLWDGGLIKVEIARKGKKTCHQGMIEQFFLDEGELITIGIDGYVKVWDFETIDTAEAADEKKIFEMEPMSELKVGPDVKLLSMVKSVHPDEASIWYAQDGAGGIWKLDLSFSHTSQAPKRLFSFHAGAITGLATSPMTHLSVTIGEDHTVRLYDYLAKTPLCVSRFTTPGSSVLWMPKEVDPDGLSVLAGFADGVVRQMTVVKGDQNTVTAKKDGSGFELKLTQVFKPHVKAVTTLAVSKDGKFLATGSEDSTVFFFGIHKKYKPIGFIETAAPVVSLDWSSAQKNNLLICCKDGCVLEVSCPNDGDYDTSKTFLIPLTGLKRTEFKFKSIKDKLVKAEEDLRKAKEEEERRKQQEEEKRKRKARGIEDDEEEGEEDKENEEENEAREDTPAEEIIHEPGQIVNGFYKGDDGNFWLLLDGWDAGYVYECAFPESQDEDVVKEPLKASKFKDIDDVPVRSHCFSKTGNSLALGLDNGAVRVQVIESRDMEKLDSYWSLNMHDNSRGAVTDITMSFDEKFLLSAGNDGNFFIYSFMDEEKLKKIIGKQKAEILKKLESSKIARIDDIEDPNHYSIELEKQKAEHDRMVRLAEEKKQQARQTISLLRREFKRLVSRNQEMPSYLQLPPVEFIIDPNMKSDIEAETKKRLELVEREMAWESEKFSLSVRKLEMRFKDMIECEMFRLHAFRTPHTVSSYRATILPPEFNEVMEQNMNKVKTAEAEAGMPFFGKRFSSLAKKIKETSKEETSAEDKEALHAKKSKPLQSFDGKVAKAIEKAEQKKKRRLERKAKWDELYRSRPDLDYEDPAILATIKEAQENMGDFKLKSAKDYIVPEKERVNADKKRIQLMQLKEQIYQCKRHFNEKLLMLRDKKIAVIAEVRALADELDSVQNELPLSMHISLPPVPVMLPDEQPEKLFEYTAESLEKFKKEMEHQGESLKTENTGGFGGGFGGFGASEQAQQSSTKVASQLATTRTGTDQRGRSTSILSTLSSQPRSASSVVIDHGSPETISEETMIDDEPSDMELRVRDEKKVRTIYRRDMLLRKIKELLVTFDAELRTLRHEKVHLDVDLKNADLRMITLFEELILLKEFEKRENVLMGKVELKMQEKADMEDKVEDCQMKLQSKKEEIEKLQEKEKSLNTMFSNLFIESNKFEAFLTKVFKKKIKRAKKTEQDAGSDEDSDEDLSDEDYDSDEDEDSDAEDLDDSVCPPGCDQALFDQVCQLREKRLDLEEATTEEKKAAETLKKELDALKKKSKIIENALQTAEADLEAFQREKQQKLNELDIVVTLKLSQLQYLNNNALPQDLSQCLVFTSTSLDGLQTRITELEKEKAEQKKLYWKLRQQHVTLIRDKKSMEEKISQLEEKVQQMQLLKFGKLVDLEKLETVSVNRAAEELKEQLRTQEFGNAKEVAAWEKRIDDAKARLTQVTRENTQRLDTFTVLLQEKKELEHQLDSRQKNLGGEFQGNRKADFQERQRLIQLVQLQSQEIDALKEEIGLLSRKGGHILPPSQAPVPTAPASTR